MINSRGGIVAVLMAGALLGGCNSTRMMPTAPAGPEPLPASPSGRVESRTPLPPPSSPDAFPTTPEAPQTASAPVDAAAAAPAGGGGPVNKNAMLGSWRAGGGDNCQVFMTLTKFGQVSRGGSRGCSSDLQKMRGWDVKGQQVVLYDDSGNQIAALYASGGGRYDGQTSSGQAVSLSR